MKIRHSLNSIKNKKKVKDSWDCKYRCSGGDYLGGFSWPQSSYMCSFCKREFRCAQALGGHMNVHKRERARLRQSSPPWDGQGPELNLNPYCSTAAFQSTMVPPFTYRFPSLLAPHLNCFSSLLSPASCVEVKILTDSLPDPSSSARGDNMRMETVNPKALFGVGELKGFNMKDECRVVNKEEIVRLDLEIGQCRDSKDELDLELRLGYS